MTPTFVYNSVQLASAQNLTWVYRDTLAIGHNDIGGQLGKWCIPSEQKQGKRAIDCLGQPAVDGYCFYEGMRT